MIESHWLTEESMSSHSLTEIPGSSQGCYLAFLEGVFSTSALSYWTGALQDGQLCGFLNNRLLLIRFTRKKNKWRQCVILYLRANCKQDKLLRNSGNKNSLASASHQATSGHINHHVSDDFPSPACSTLPDKCDYSPLPAQWSGCRSNSVPQQHTWQISCDIFIHISGTLLVSGFCMPVRQA